MIRSSTPFKFITIIFASAFFFIIQQALSYDTGPPDGMTGAPSESNCTSCHSGTATSNSSNISMFTNMTNGQYIPDSTYQITVRARTSGCSKFGFETTLLNSNATPSKMGTLSIPTSATDVQKSAGTRDYIMHTFSGTTAIYTDSTDWTFNWLAPSTLSGTGKLYVAMNATNGDGTSSGDQINLHEFSFPQTTNVPVATITTNVNTICQNDSVFFQGSATNSTSSYQWTFPGGTPSSSTVQNLYVKFASSGSKVCSLRVANSIMNSAYVTKTITVNALPSATITYNSTQVLCEGDSIALTATLNAGFTYQWQKDGNTISGATANVFYATLNGNYRVIVTGSGCSITTSPVTLSFNAKPAAILTAPGGTSSCPGDSVRLKANSGTGLSYAWFKDNVLQSTTADSNFYAKQGGLYQVKVSSSTCTTLSNALSISFFVKPSGSITSALDTICQGDSVLLTANTSDTISVYQWKRNGSNTGSNNKNYYALSSGAYTVDITTNRGCKATAGPKIITVNALPAANFIDSLKVGCVYSLKIRNTGNFSFQWQRNGVTFNITDTVVTASLTGVYTLKITNSSGCSNTTNSISLNVPNAPNANITPVANAVICSDSIGVTYQVPLVSGTTYQWFKNSIVINGATQNSLNIVDSGNYFVVVNNGTCAVQSSTRNVKVNPLPSANFIDSVKSGCAYTLKIRTTGNFNLQWSRNGAVINTTDTLITASQSGTYMLKITNGSGCSINTNSITLSLPSNLPDASITPSGNAVLCSDSSGVTYRVPAASGTTYKWYKNGTLINGATQNSLNITDSGNYFVTVETSFCTATSPTRNVKINPKPTANITTADSSFCTGDSSVLITNVVSGAAYQWNKNNAPLPNTNANKYSAKVAGLYSVKVILNSCETTSNSVNVTEKSLPPAPVISRNVDVLTSTPAISYQWFKNGSAISGATQQGFTVTGSGTYVVQITGANGCRNISEGLFVIASGINNASITNIVTAYPNPVHHNLHLNFGDYGLHEIQVYDASGRILKMLHETDSKAVLDFSDVEAGIYFVKVSSGITVQILRVVKK